MSRFARAVDAPAAFATRALLAIAPLFPATANAEPAPLRIEWTAPPECPRREAVAAKVRKLLGPAAAERSEFRAEGVIESRTDGYRLHLVVQDGQESGERTLTAKRCEDLVGAAAVALALLYSNGVGETAPVDSVAANGAVTDAGTSSETAPATDPSTPKATPMPAVPPPSEQSEGASPSNPRPAPRRWRLLLDAPLLGAALGPLPDPRPVLGAGAGVEAGAWSVRLVVYASSSQQIPAQRLSGYGADAWLAGAALWGCHELGDGDWRFSPCVLLGADYLRAGGYGRFLSPSARGALWPVVGIAAIGRLRLLERLAVAAGVSGQLHVARPTLTLEEVGLVTDLAPVAAILFVAPEWNF